MKYFRIYGKEKAKKTFQAYDYSSGSFVKNLIYATLIKESEIEKAEKAVKFMNDNNPEYIFELRGV
jgi:hypothetical protein